MGKGLHNLAKVLEVAEELHSEGSLTEDNLLRLVSAAETSLHDEKRFLTELRVWATELLQLDDVENISDVMRKVLMAFLQSPDADDNQLRGDALVIFGQFERLLVSCGNYDQQGVAKKLLDHGR